MQALTSDLHWNSYSPQPALGVVGKVVAALVWQSFSSDWSGQSGVPSHL